MPTWAIEFRPFGLIHVASLAWTLGALAVSIMLGRRWRREGNVGAERELAGAWGGFVICVNVWNTVYWLLPENYDITKSLPLHVCDLTCLVAPLVFLTEWRWARAVVYFWGLALSTQAFITPTLREGPADMQYWLFWLVHLGIVGSAVYDLCVRRYRPVLRDLWLVIGVSLGYLALVMLVNKWLGANYGYVADSHPANPTIIDRIGPWPQRVVVMVVIAIGLMGVLWAVWPVADLVRGRASRAQAR